MVMKNATEPLTIIEVMNINSVPKDYMNKVNWVKLYCTNLVHIQVRNYKINNGVRYISRYCWTKLIKIKK